MLFFCVFVAIFNSAMATVPSNILLNRHFSEDLRSVNLIKAMKTIVFEDLNERLSSDINQYIYIAYSSRHRNQRYKIPDIATSLLMDLKNHTYSINLHKAVEFKHFLHNELILVDTPSTLRSLYKVLLRHRTRNLSHTLIYFAAIDNPYDDQIRTTLELLWQLNTLNVGIIVEMTSHAIVLVTYFPYRHLSCQNVEPLIVNRFDSSLGVWASRDYFPDKLQNFYGCRLTCATWEEVPYMVVERDEHGNITDYSGLEGGLLDYMAERLNFTISLYLMSPDEVVEANNGNHTFFRQLFSQSADYALGGFFYKPDPNGTAPFSQSKFYFMSSIHLVTNIVSDYTPYEKLAFPFRMQVWLIIGLMYVIGCALIGALGYTRPVRRAFVMGPNNRSPYFNMFVTFVGAHNAMPLPRRNFARFLLTVWLLATLVLRSAYQSGMYQMLRENRHRNPPVTIRDVTEQDYIIEMVPSNEVFLASLPEVKRVRLLNVTELEEFGRLSSLQQRTAIITAYEYYGYFRKLHPNNMPLHVVRELIFTQQLSFYVRRNSFLVDVFNEQIIRARTHGFADQWTDGLLDMSKSKIQPNAETRGLSITELEAIFMIMLWSHLGAVVVFVMELLVARRATLANIWA